jgi:putative sigma-54 modulation protein
MDKKITFHNMDHSDPMEQHALEKLSKIEELLEGAEWETPKFLELWLEAHKTHPHNKVELHLKTPQFDLHAHSEETDIYFAIDETVDKIIKLLKKEKQKLKDKNQKVSTDKKNFSNDKYNL